MTATQKSATNNQPAKSQTCKGDDFKLFADLLDIKDGQLDLPENAMTKTIVEHYAAKLTAGGDKEMLTSEFLALFDNSPGRYALEMAKAASDGAGELARDTGRRVGQALKDGMRAEFNIGVREGMAAETVGAPDMVALGKSQVDSYFARIEGEKENKQLPKET